MAADGNGGGGGGGGRGEGTGERGGFVVGGGGGGGQGQLYYGDDGGVFIGGVEVADITRWTLLTRQRSKSYASSATGGFRRRLPGAKEGVGAVHFKLNLAQPISDPLDVGAEVTLRLYLNADLFYNVPAVIDSLELEVDVDSDDPLGGVAEFSTNGAWTAPGYSA